MINLYEYECISCDMVMQIQISKPIEQEIKCICGSDVILSFHSEIIEPVFPAEGNYEEMDVQMSTMSDDTDN